MHWKNCWMKPVGQAHVAFSASHTNGERQATTGVEATVTAADAHRSL